ncbi:MAG: transposase [Planctomycetes bacterium]|nr:transposase [Planctomycetota bacterium]
MRCGILAHGFARVHCDGCGHDDVVAFSCKGRGFCPSCGSARMVDTAAWLVDAVIPAVPVRQWVLSLPYRLRALCAYDPAACALVRSVLVRAVAGFYERTARRTGVPHARGGALAFVQRFDSALRLNVHFHVLWLDGVYGWEPGRGPPVFHEHAGFCDGDVELLVQRLCVRVRRALRKLGKWVDAEDAADGGDEVGDELLPGLVAAAIEGRAALGECAGQRDGRVGQSYAGQQAPRQNGPLCAESGGFSLHAGAWVAARDRERLAKLCRYAGRPAVAESRLVELGGGRIGYALKKRWRDGTTAVVMTQEVLMECLCALVPRLERDVRDVGGCRHEDDAGAAAVASADLDDAVVAASVHLRRRLAERQRRQRLRVPHGGGRRSGARRRLP